MLRGVHHAGVTVAITEGPNAGARAFYVRDPDGHTVELFQPPSER